MIVVPEVDQSQSLAKGVKKANPYFPRPAESVPERDRRASPKCLIAINTGVTSAQWRIRAIKRHQQKVGENTDL